MSTTANAGVFRPQENNERLPRIILLGSIFNYMCEGKPTKEKLILLNKEFELVKVVDSLWIPTLLSRIIWKKLKFCKLIEDVKDDKLTTVEATQILLSRTPKFLNYTNIETDLHKVISYSIESM